MSNTENFQTFIENLNMSMRKVQLFARLDGFCEGLMTHYQVKLTNHLNATSIVICYSVGSAVKKITTVDVVYSLLADYTEDTFPDWCPNYGYDTDSVKARSTYEACLSNGETVKKLLGEDFAKAKELSYDY